MESQETRVNPTIRRATVEDAEAVARIFEGPRVIWGTIQLPYPSADIWRKRLQEGPSSGVVSLLACVAEEPVGILGLHTHPDQPRIRHVASLGMAVRDDWQGRGIGKALMRSALEMADQWLALVRVELTVFIDNEAAIRLYEGFGFKMEGTLCRAALRDGEHIDVLMMARLAPGKR
jgi:putative acetyltransferase